MRTARLNKMQAASDPRRWVEAAVLSDGKAGVPHALLVLLANDVTMRRYAGGLLWARLAARTMPRALATLEAVMDDEKSGAVARVAAVRLAAELAGLLTRAGEGASAALGAGAGEETLDAISPARLIEVGRDASERIARLEKRLSGETISPAW